MTDQVVPFFMTPAEIYRQLTEGPGAALLRTEQIDAGDEWSAEQERADLIRSLADTIKAGWQGEASAGAYGAAMPLAELAIENAVKIGFCQELLARQIESFDTAVNSVRPVSGPPENSMDEPFPFDVDYEKSVTDYQDGAQHNIAVFRVYDDASSFNETNTPQDFNNGARSSGDVSVAGPVDTMPVTEPGPRSAVDPRDVGQVKHSSSSFGAPWSVSGDLAEPGVASGGFETSPNDFQPAPPALSSPVTSLSSPGLGQSPVSASPTGGFVGGVPVGGSPGGGSGGFGPRGGGGTGGGSGGVRNLGPGMGAGAVAAEDAAARRAGQAAAAAARPGGAGPVGAPVGAGRGKGDEDTEHQRKVLIENDAEETFGSDVLTAPTVIGDDEYED
ncbi:hypothetical protein [Actinophytocola sp.]|uniref:hypothetical protein n=1 Tax=Actinophytocola sp. TaxID=1872138 RepID=UPI002ED011CE